jgi:hypothetical protein
VTFTRRYDADEAGCARVAAGAFVKPAATTDRARTGRVRKIRILMPALLAG